LVVEVFETLSFRRLSLQLERSPFRGSLFPFELAKLFSCRAVLLARCYLCRSQLNNEKTQGECQKYVFQRSALFPEGSNQIQYQIDDIRPSGSQYRSASGDGAKLGRRNRRQADPK
jgi:hypothetical protein